MFSLSMSVSMSINSTMMMTVVVLTAAGGDENQRRTREGTPTDAFNTAAAEESDVNSTKPTYKRASRLQSRL